MGVEHTMVESSNLGVFGIGDEHCKKEKKNFLNKKIYVKVVQVVGFLYMNHRAKYCLEGVFVRGGGGGGHMVSYMKYHFLLCPPTFTGSWCNTKIHVLQFCQLYNYTYIYQFISLFLVKTDIH